MSDDKKECGCEHEEHNCGCGSDEEKCFCGVDSDIDDSSDDSNADEEKSTCCCDSDEEKSDCCCGSDEERCCCGGDSDEKESDGDSGSEEETDSFDFEALGDVPLPKPTLTTVAMTLAQQAMVSMGVLPNPITRKATFMLNQASHLIDTVVLILDKTEGNRTDAETETLNNIIHELRMLYVAASNEKKRRDEEKNKEGEKKEE
jgi:hypothetical protein